MPIHVVILLMMNDPFESLQLLSDVPDGLANDGRGPSHEQIATQVV